METPMDKNIITEAALMAPTFTGGDDEIASATQSWSSIISAFSYMSQLGCYNNAAMSIENKKAIFAALGVYVSAKLQELSNITPPPEVATSAPAFVPAPEAATVDMCDPEEEIEINYAESKTDTKEVIAEEVVNPFVKRMRELAGVPHPSNMV